MSASQAQAGATGAGEGVALLAPRRDETAAGRQTAVRRAWWQRLCLSSFLVGGVTILIVWVAVSALLRQGRLETVFSAGRAELAAPLLVLCAMSAPAFAGQQHVVQPGQLSAVVEQRVSAEDADRSLDTRPRAVVALESSPRLAHRANRLRRG